jgi:hypothetical protein
MISDCNFNKLKIDQPYISIFASGPSINALTLEDFSYIKEKTYMVGTNYFILKYLPHMAFWSDYKVTDFMTDYYRNKEKDCILCSREEGFSVAQVGFKVKVDYWFDKKYYNLYGNFTSFSAMQLFQRFFPDKPILLFGMDFQFNPGILKFYDTLTDHDSKDRNDNKYPSSISRLLENLNHFYTNKDTSKIYNCYLDSALNLFQKKNYKEVLL